MLNLAHGNSYAQAIDRIAQLNAARRTDAPTPEAEPPSKEARIGDCRVRVHLAPDRAHAVALVEHPGDPAACTLTFDLPPKAPREGWPRPYSSRLKGAILRLARGLEIQEGLRRPLDP